MKQTILGIVLILSFGSIGLPQDALFSFNEISTFPFDEFVKFDEYQKLSLDDEKERLNNLFVAMENDKAAKSLILFKLKRSDSRKKNTDRFRAILSYLDEKKADKSRITFAFTEDDDEQTMIWVEPQDYNLLDLISGEAANYKIIKAEELERKFIELFPKK